MILPGMCWPQSSTRRGWRNWCGANRRVAGEGRVLLQLTSVSAVVLARSLAGVLPVWFGGLRNRGDA